jgi:hypothetical protein
MVRPCHRAARQQQNQRIDQRQIKGVDRIDHRLDIFCSDIGVHRIHGVLEKAPEPCRKEHDFGHDEQDKPVAQPDHHHRRMVARMRFDDHILPPLEHHIQHTRQPIRNSQGPLPCIQSTAPNSMTKAETEATKARWMGATRDSRGSLLVPFLCSLRLLGSMHEFSLSWRVPARCNRPEYRWGGKCRTG